MEVKSLIKRWYEIRQEKLIKVGNWKIGKRADKKREKTILVGLVS